MLGSAGMLPDWLSLRRRNITYSDTALNRPVPTSKNDTPVSQRSIYYDDYHSKFLDIFGNLIPSDVVDSYNDIKGGAMDTKRKVSGAVSGSLLL